MEKDTNENETISIPFIVHEAALSRIERINKRLWILAIVIFTAFVFSNIYWINNEMQYEDVLTETYETTTSANNPVFVNGNGTLNYNDKD